MPVDVTKSGWPQGKGQIKGVLIDTRTQKALSQFTIGLVAIKGQVNKVSKSGKDERPLVINKTSAGGEFRFDKIPMGEYTLVPFDMHFNIAGVLGDESGKMIKVNLKEGQKVDLDNVYMYKDWKAMIH
jgi:hypothetical protein